MPDILILGATGVTGRQAVKYLLTHPEKNSFNWSIAGRSKTKIDALVKELSIPDNVNRLIVDTTNPSDVEKAVKDFKVVVNLVGPYSKWGGTHVVKACVSNGVHYTDLTGESWWIKEIITEFDYLANKNGTIIIPSCGFDSVPAELVAHIARKSLNEHSSNYLGMGRSVSAYKFKGGLSGGTAATMVNFLIEIPKETRRQHSRKEYLLSPILGKASPKPQLSYELQLPDTKKTLTGAMFFMQQSNRALVQRTWGLLEHQVLDHNTPENQKARYGPDFTYEEIMVTKNATIASAISLVMFIGIICITRIPLVAWLFKNLVPQPGMGPSDTELETGRFEVTNITTASTESSSPPVQVKTTFKGHGDPGYYLSPHMVVESALAILLERKSLPPAALKGGVLTPAFALGDVLVERLKRTGRFEFDSRVVVDKKHV